MAKLALVAKGEGFDKAPTKGEVWGLGTYFLHRHCTMAFEAHDLSWSLAECIRHAVAIKGHLLSPREIYATAEWKHKLFKMKAKWINEYEIPFVSVARYDESNPVQGIVVPTSIEYPLSDVLFSVLDGRSYLVGSFSFMLAYAVHTGKYDHIEIYGCELAAEEEWAYQRPNTEHILGIALGRGIRVDLMTKTSLLSTPNNAIYGYLSTYEKIVPDNADLDWDAIAGKLGFGGKNGLQDNAEG